MKATTVTMKVSMTAQEAATLGTAMQEALAQHGLGLDDGDPAVGGPRMTAMVLMAALKAKLANVSLSDWMALCTWCWGVSTAADEGVEAEGAAETGGTQ